MPQIKDLKNVELLNLLTKHTTLYTQMLTNNIKTEEFYVCKRIIEALTTEITARKKYSPSGQVSVDSTNTPSYEE